jgi:hypothetical protein
MGVLGAAPARFRRPHVLHADVGELTLHLALLDLKLAWSRIQAMERARKKPELQAENAQNMQHVLFLTCTPHARL